MNIQPQTIAVKKGSQTANSDIARLKGARFVTTTEPNKGMQLDEGSVKQLTGDDKVTARFLYGKEFEFEPEFKIWMATNHKPVISGTDDGIWRRIAIVPFEYKIPKDKIDKKLTGKLKAELAGILNWCIEGYQMWRENGLMEPAIIDQQRNEYRSEMDIIHQFIEEKCLVNPLAEIQAKDIWRSFREWVEEGNEYSGMSKTKFGIELTKKFNKKKKNDGTYYQGITLNDDEREKIGLDRIFSGLSELN